MAGANRQTGLAVGGASSVTDDPNVALARQAFAAGGDQASIELVPVERGARLRLEFGEGVLRFFGLVAGKQAGLVQ